MKRGMAIIMAVLLSLGVVDFSYFPLEVRADAAEVTPQEFDISTGDIVIDDETITIYDGTDDPIEYENNRDTYTITQSTQGTLNHIISIDGTNNINIILSGLSLTGEEAGILEEDDRGASPALSIGEGAIVNLIVTGENTLNGGVDYPAITVDADASLNLSIESAGVLKAIGGENGAGIACEAGNGTLIIDNNGTLVAQGGINGDGIQIGDEVQYGNITISGGTTIAASGEADEESDGIDSILGRLQLHESASVYINDMITPEADSEGYILFQNSAIVSGNIIEPGEGTVFGDVQLAKNMEIQAGKPLSIFSGTTLTIPKGITLSVAGTLKNNGKILNKGIFSVLSGAEFLQNGTITYNGTIQNAGIIYAYSSIREESVTNIGDGIIKTVKTITVSPNAGLWKYYGQELDITANDYQLSVNGTPYNLPVTGLRLDIDGESVGTHQYLLKTDGSLNYKDSEGNSVNIVLAEKSPAFEVRSYKAGALVSVDSKWYGRNDLIAEEALEKNSVAVDAPDGYLISPGKDAGGKWNWDESFDVDGDTLAEGENIIYYYLQSDTGTEKGAIDTEKKKHVIRVDTIAPVIRILEVQDDAIEDIKADCLIRSEEAGTYYYIVLPEGVAAPVDSKDIQLRVKTGQGICGSGSMDKNKDTIIGLKGMIPETDYIIYAVVKDQAGNLSEVSTSEVFTTDKNRISGSARLNGEAVYGKTLTVVPAISTANAGSMSYRWYRTDDVTDVDSWEEIEGAVGGTYTVTLGDIGKYICVKIFTENCSGDIAANSMIVPQLKATYTLPRISARTYNPSVKLKSIKLPDGWEWEQPDMVPAAGTNYYTAIYTPKDENYAVALEQISIKIKSKSLTENMVKNLKSKLYTGKEIRSDFYLKDGKVKLKENKDYTVSYKNNKNLGFATITIKGKKNYSGTLKSTFEIKRMDVKNLKMNTVSDVAYNGNPLTPKVNIMNGKVKLKKDQDYVISYNNNIEIGTGQIIVEGIGNYKGSATLKFTITPSKPKLKMIRKSASSMTIKYDSKYGADCYEVAYSTSKKFPSNNINQFSTESPYMMIANLEKNTVYYVKVRAYKMVGEKKIYSSYSSVLKIKLQQS